MDNEQKEILEADFLFVGAGPASLAGALHLKSLTKEKYPDLSIAIIYFVKELRKVELFKQPGIAETIDWAQAIVELNYISINPEVLETTIGSLLKNQDDIKKLKDSEAAKILTTIQTEISLINRK